MLEVAGFRYYADKLTNPLEVGCDLELLPEPQNEKDSGAVEIRAHGERIGYVNRLQAPTFLKWLAERHVSVTLERLNGSRNHPRAFIFVRVRAAENNKKAA
jgi:hypothetical protein